MNNQFAKKVSQYIYDKSKKAVFSFELTNNKIKYATDIKSSANITEIKGDEEVVRAYLLTRLINELGYNLEDVELERFYEAGRPKTIKPRVDIIVKQRGSEDIFLYIELKGPDQYEQEQDEAIEKQLFNLAALETPKNHKVKYLVYYSVDAETLTDKCIVIDYDSYKSFDKWKDDRNAADQLPTDYGVARKEPYVKGGKRDLETVFSSAMLSYIRADLHKVLWGGGGTDDNIVFSSLTNIILAKIQDEDERKRGEKYMFQRKMTTDGDSFETNDELFDRINELYRRALKNKLNITDIKELEKSFVIDSKQFSLSKLKYAVYRLENYSFVDGKNNLDGKDILGDFFEGIIREGFKQSKGQFFTHIKIVVFMLWAMQIDRLAIQRVNNDLELPYCIDPTGGSGTFLIEYMKFITECVRRRFRKMIDDTRAIQDRFASDWFPSDNRENKWASQYIYGGDINFNLGTAIKVNMILHGDGSTNIFVGSPNGDGLLPFSEYKKETAPNALNQSNNDRNYPYPINGQFDVILTNPPFSVDLDEDTKKKVKSGFLFGDKKNSENLFIERYYQLLKPNGRLGVVLPESVFDTSENIYIRLFIYKYFKVKAVVSLPDSAFAPFTTTKTSILFAQKKTAEEISKWDELWQTYEKEWSKLKTRCENILDVASGKKQKEKLSSIKNLTEEEECTLLFRMLKDVVSEQDKSLDKKHLIEKYNQDLVSLCTIDKDTKDTFGHVNIWWVFSEVAKLLNYNIFMAEAEFVGYKRTKRGENLQPNDLYRSEGLNVLVDDGVTKTILDYMRKDVNWD